MTMILIAIIASILLTTALLWYISNNYDSGIAYIFALIMSLGSGAAVLAYIFAGYQWFAADYKAQIINREYGTAYTKEDIFWASDVIDKIRQLDRKRIEINGDLMRDKDR